MTRTLLVANRGEIAVRILATAAVLGWRTVAIHPADDADSLHVASADAAVELPGEGATAYLDVAAVVAAAVAAGADALHPGYGFLSENPALARACAAAGVSFVGPSPEALELFGDKTAARRRAAELGIDTPRGSDVVGTEAEARAFLDAVGTAMVKARSGGGGRGMRPVAAGDDLAKALQRSRSEAQAAFGDDGVFLEERLTGVRHIEVQVVGDGTRVLVLGDRDCSLQRRRQKVLEIAPALDLPDDVRVAAHEAARRLIGSVPYVGLATVELLVGGARVAFLEVNPRLQVEHTVTEEVTGLDLVALALGIATGDTLDGMEEPTSRGVALQARVNAETLQPDGTVTPSGGTVERFAPPTGPGVRVDTAAFAGYRLNPRYDSLLAKVSVHAPDRDTARRRLARAVGDLELSGVATNLTVLQSLAALDLGTAEITTDWIDEHLEELVSNAAPVEPADDAVIAPMQGVVVKLADRGSVVAPGAEVAVIEAMKMEHAITAPLGGTLGPWQVRVGDVVEAGAVLAALDVDDTRTADGSAAAVDLDRVRPDLAASRQRHHMGLDEGRPEVVAKRHARGRRTARENIADLVDAGSFVEYGALAIAAQRQRRTLEDLIANTPADGMITGTATIGGAPVAVLSYDYTVLAGTQGLQNHRKTDRLYSLALEERLPLVLFAEGGGGRPGDTDTASVASLDVTTFRLAAQLYGKVPTVAVVAGYCFAGNAALASACDLIVGTEGSSLGMGGPAMIEGGGLGVVAPGEVGPMNVQTANGVVDVLVADDATAVDVARRYVRLFTTAPTGAPEVSCADQRILRHLIPESRTRAYAVRPVAEAIVDEGSLLEVRRDFGVGILTAFARLEGRPLGLLANNPQHLGGAIDGDAADKATRFLEICDARGLPVLSLCDTPGFMVGPAAERTATVRRFGAMFVAGARLRSPLVTVVLRKGYGLGAMAMAGGDLKRPAITVAWPTGEFGGMGLEGAVRLGFRRELEAIADLQQRQARYEQLVAASYERGQGLSMAGAFEIDDVIDPAQTRAVVASALFRRTAAGR